MPARHDPEFFGLRGVGRLQIDLRHELRRADDGMYGALAAASDQLTQADDGAGGCAVQVHVAVSDLARSSARRASMNRGCAPLRGGSNCARARNFTTWDAHGG